MNAGSAIFDKSMGKKKRGVRKKETYSGRKKKSKDWGGGQKKKKERKLNVLGGGVVNHWQPNVHEGGKKQDACGDPAGKKKRGQRKGRRGGQRRLLPNKNCLSWRQGGPVPKKGTMRAKKKRQRPGGTPSRAVRTTAQSQ